MLDGTKLNRIESKISEALINNEISHQVFTAIINEKMMNLIKALEWWNHKEVILKKKKFIEEGERKSIDGIIRQNA